MSSGSPEAEPQHVNSPRRPESLTDEEKEKKEKRLAEIRAQIEQIKKQIEESDGRPLTASESRRRGNSDDEDDNVGGPASAERNSDLSNKDSSFRKPYEAKKRQRETIERVHRFKDKLREISKKASGEPQLTDGNPSTSSDLNNEIEDESGLLDMVDDDSWLKHRFEAKDEPNSDFEDQEDERHSRRQHDRGSRHAEKDSRRHGDRSRSSSRSRRNHSSPDTHHRRRVHKYRDGRDSERSSRDKHKDRHHRRH